MVRFPNWILMVVVVGLSACTADSDDSSPEQVQQSGAQSGAHDAKGDTWRGRYLALGRDTYARVCASCHDENEGDASAPLKGDRESWTNRSPLWAAVLFEHAKSGYVGMPVKGGYPDLTEREVEAAGEYMLSETFPELPRD